MWEAKVLVGNGFGARASFPDKYDAVEKADFWASNGFEVWVCKVTDGRSILDKVFKGKAQ